MGEFDDKKLLWMIKYLPLVLMAVFILIAAVLIVGENKTSLQEDISSLRNNFYDNQKITIRNRVINVVEQIKVEKRRTENNLQRNIKERVNEAASIARHLYQLHHQSQPELTKEIILEAIRPIRYNEGRGYYFIYDINGVNVMHPISPNLEGKNLIDLKDAKGNLVIKDLATIAQTQGSGYHRWWWPKPDDLKSQYEKIGYVIKFEPYNWFIGTGEYVDDVEKDDKEKLLDSISEYRFDNGDYVFVMDSKGALLAHPNESLIGVERLDVKDQSGKLYIRELVNKAKSGGGYVNYFSSYRPSGATTSDKLSYVEYFPEWDWIIGTGVYLNPIENFLAHRAQSMTASNEREMERIGSISAAVLVILAAFSLIIGRAVGQRFLRLQERVAKNIGELEDTRDQLHYQAYHDSLTLLPNRRHMKDYLNDLIEKNEMAAIMFVDMDNFKKVNDSLGHHSGDKLLTLLGERFGHALDREHIVARFGGDEFVFCIPKLADPIEAQQIANQIKDTLQEQFWVYGKLIYISCSVGVALFPRDGSTPDELISKADTALYTAKSRHKGQILFYDDEIQKKTQHDLLLEKELRKAIANDELYMVYQPQVDLKSEKVVSVEALLRWENPKLGSVSPVELIKKAEEIGIIDQIGLFVIERTCCDFNQNFQNEALGLSINLSPSQLICKGFVDDLIRIVDDAKLDHSRITLEITENVLIDDLESVTPTLSELRKAGFSVSLDDFGTGFSSLSYLYNLPINEIKIDRSFVDKMMVNEQSDTLIKAIVAIGHAHSSTIVAEGIETEQQEQRLKEYGCSLGQGYLFSKPLKVNDLLIFIANSESNLPRS
ncbi:cache domain-containing protein [Vibrio sp. S4M6]|uniref:bifunctional diguanylate cyclase/phosphodiesterase n=1 Tax=Vibrio sinus TaxID=2946865 RepID=UPI002029DDAF|nr:cache domain-containing protein [Vibrio sinus]MCL9779936.1 cache domain-containing protein [Vibrio sinus]